MIHNPVALEKATAAADALLAEDGNLTRPEHLALRAEVDSLFERIETAS